MDFTFALTRLPSRATGTEFESLTEIGFPETVKFTGIQSATRLGDTQRYPSLFAVMGIPVMLKRPLSSVAE